MLNFELERSIRCQIKNLRDDVESGVKMKFRVGPQIECKNKMSSWNDQGLCKIETLCQNLKKPVKMKIRFKQMSCMSN